MHKTAQHKKAIIEALEQSLGVVTTACKKVGIGRRTYYSWLNQDPEFKKQVEDIENISLDFVESQLFKQIKEGNTTATIFYLKTKGKHRGYVERLDHDITTNGKELSTRIISIDPLSTDDDDEANE